LWIGVFAKQRLPNHISRRKRLIAFFVVNLEDFNSGRFKGTNYQEPDSPSWFNPHEAYQVAAYLQKLINVGVSPEEIGIMSPYRKQTRKIRIVLERSANVHLSRAVRQIFASF